MVYAIMDEDNNIIKIKKQLNHITSCNRCHSDSDSGDMHTVLAVVEINVIQTFLNNKTGVAAIREFNKTKGKNVPNDIIPGII